MVLEHETDVVVDGSIGGAGNAPPPMARTIQADGDDARDLLEVLTSAFDSRAKKRPDVQVVGSTRSGTLLTDDVIIDIQQISDVTPEGIIGERTSIVVISGLGWLGLDSNGIREPSPGFPELGTPTLEQARTITYAALDAVLLNPPQRATVPRAA